MRNKKEVVRSERVDGEEKEGERDESYRGRIGTIPARRQWISQFVVLYRWEGSK